MVCPRNLERTSCSRATDDWRAAWGGGPREALHAHAEPRDRPRASRKFAAAAGSGISPHRSDPARKLPWAQPNGSAEGEWNGVDASSFVLIVDDDPDLLEVTSFVIENEGIAVETAKNGAEALALLRADRRPKLVLLDLMMPVMNGWEFLGEIGKDLSLKQIPIVVLTAHAHVPVTGAVEVLAKPMELTALLKVVERYARGDENGGS